MTKFGDLRRLAQRLKSSVTFKFGSKLHAAQSDTDSSLGHVRELSGQKMPVIIHHDGAGSAY